MDSFHSDSPIVTRLIWVVAGVVVGGLVGFQVAAVGEDWWTIGVGAGVGALLGLVLGPTARHLFDWILGGHSRWM